MTLYEDLEAVYAWIDKIPLSRCKKNLTRDFADGVLMAEVCKHEFPKLVDLHNYPPANSHASKIINWQTLNRKVFMKLHVKVTSELIHQIAAGVPGALESVLMAIKQKAESRNKKLSSTTFSSNGESVFENSKEEAFVESEDFVNLQKFKSEIQFKNDTINILNQKVTHLENLLKIKDKRLKELTFNVERLKARSEDSQESFHTSSG